MEETFGESTRTIMKMVKVSTLKLRTRTLSLMEATRDTCGMLNVYVHDARKDFGLVTLMYKWRIRNNG